MRTIAIIPTLISLFLTTGTSVTLAEKPVYQKDIYQKGYSSNLTGPCCRHCKDDRGSRDAASRDALSWLPLAPVGAVVDSIPVTRAVPSLVSMPMMAGIPVSLAASSVCDSKDERIDELDARVEALHLRMVTIQRSIELQTKILEELRDKGSIGGTRLPGRP